MLSTEDLSYFKNKLLEEREKLQSDIRELEAPPDFGNEPGPDEETDEVEEALDNTAIAHGYRIRMADIDAALLRMEKKTFGICEKTGKEIPREVLEVNPSARFHPDYIKEKRGIF